MSWRNCPCGIKPEQHIHSKDSDDIFIITTIGTEDIDDIKLSEDDLMLLAEAIMFPKKKNNKKND